MKELLEPERQFLVDAKISDSKIRRKITVLIDTDSGIGIDECTKVSRELGAKLEELIEDAYILEVSSPGLDTPLKLKRQYSKNSGKKLKVITDLGIEYIGELKNVDESGIVILPEKKKKDKTRPEEVRLAFDNIKEARVQVSFN